MRAIVLVSLLGACAGPREPGPYFVYASGGRPTPPVTDVAVPVRGVQAVLAAEGRYLGTVSVHATGADARLTVVRDAERAAAAAGGTHLMLQRADVTRIAPSSYVDFKRDARSVDSNSAQSLPQHVEQTERPGTGTGHDREVTATFDVFRVEPERWGELVEPLRPRPR